MRPLISSRAYRGLWSAIMIYTMIVALVVIVIGAINGSFRVFAFGLIAFLLALAGFRENYKDSDG